jgi:heat shock protein HslJ
VQWKVSVLRRALSNRGLDQLNTQSRLGLLAALVLSVSPVLVSDALAQGRQQMPPRGEQPQQAPPPKQEKNFPLDASWTAIQINGKPITGFRATLKVDSNLRGTGFGGCNTFSASAYPLRQQAFAVGPIAVTKMACDKGASDFERGYLMALRTARQWDLVEGRLVIKTGSGEIRFDRGI